MVEGAATAAVLANTLLLLPPSENLRLLSAAF
jgi:hypothetical protein